MKERREQGERVLILEHLAGRGGGRAVGRAPLYKNSISTEFSPLWNWLHFYPSRACVYMEGETMAVLARLEFRGGFDRRFKSSCWLLRAPTFEPGEVLHQIAQDWEESCTRWPSGPRCSFWSWSGFSCHRDSNDSTTAGVDGALTGCLAWPHAPCLSQPAALLHGQGVTACGDIPAAPMELTWCLKWGWLNG